MDLCVWFFFWSRNCLPTTLHPVSDKELKSQWLTGCTACDHNRSYPSTIFSAQIWEIQFCSPSLRCYWKTTGSTCTIVLARPFPDWYGSSMATWSSSKRMIEDSLCRPWLKDSRYRLIHSLSVLWSECLCYQSPKFLFLMRLPALIPAWFLWDDTPKRGQVPLPDQHQCFCSYAPLFSKDCGD